MQTGRPRRPSPAQHSRRPEGRTEHRLGRRGSMQSVAFTRPLLLGQTDAVRVALGSCWMGARKEAYQDARRRAGIPREAVWIQAGAGGDLAVVYLEADDLATALTILGTSARAVRSLVPRPRPPGPRHRRARTGSRPRAGARLRHQQDLTTGGGDGHVGAAHPDATEAGQGHRRDDRGDPGCRAARIGTGPDADDARSDGSEPGLHAGGVRERRESPRP